MSEQAWKPQAWSKTEGKKSFPEICHHPTFKYASVKANSTIVRHLFSEHTFAGLPSF